MVRLVSILLSNIMFSSGDEHSCKQESLYKNECDYIDIGKEKKTQVYKHRLRVGVVLNEMLSEFREFLTIC